MRKGYKSGWDCSLIFEAHHGPLKYFMFEDFKETSSVLNNFKLDHHERSDPSRKQLSVIGVGLLGLPFQVLHMMDKEALISSTLEKALNGGG